MCLGRMKHSKQVTLQSFVRRTHKLEPGALEFGSRRVDIAGLQIAPERRR